MNIMHGASLRARANNSLTLAAPMPTYSSTNSLADMLKKGTSASPATALASRVLPVPGGPTISTPPGGFAPTALPYEQQTKHVTRSKPPDGTHAIQRFNSVWLTCTSQGS
eukprot:scaffold3768_cov376-Prasinococcus_capsulatus_cf.AAC.2